MKKISLLLIALCFVSCQTTGSAASTSSDNLALGQAYMTKNAKREGVTTTASGIQYQVLRAGGSVKYSPSLHGFSPTATVMYRGFLVDGTVFDQSKTPIEFNVDRVIPGFTEALKTMPIGAIWEVTIPAHLAYGQNGPASIGPNSTLIFQIQLLELRR